MLVDLYGDHNYCEYHQTNRVWHTYRVCRYSPCVARSKRQEWTLAKREQADSRRELILRAATTRLNAAGYAGTSMAAIAADLGLTTNALYHYFDGKAAILGATFHRALDLLDRCIADAEQASGDGLSRLLLFVRAIAELIEAEPLPGGWHAVHLPRKQLLTVVERDAKQRTRLAALLQAGIADGSIRECDADSTIAIVRGGLQTFPYPTLVGRPRDPAVITGLVRLIERGLAR